MHETGLSRRDFLELSLKAGGGFVGLWLSGSVTDNLSEMAEYNPGLEAFRADLDEAVARVAEEWRPLLGRMGISLPAQARTQHGSNTLNKGLRAALDPRIHIAEYDLREQNGEVVLAHAYKDTGPRYFDWLNQVTLAQYEIKYSGDWALESRDNLGHAIDIKDNQALISSLTYIKAYRHLFPWSVIRYNADVIPGWSARSSQVDRDLFYEYALELNTTDAIIFSPSWVVDGKSGTYTKRMVEEMHDYIQNFPGMVTLPVRADLIRRYYKLLRPLLDNPLHTLTLWSRVPVLMRDFNWIVNNLDPARTFWDVPAPNLAIEIGDDLGVIPHFRNAFG